MIDQHGFRTNVGIILVNDKDQLFWGKRVRQHAWQFPQGGLNEDEETIDCMYRELFEEVGLKRDDVTLLGQTKNWLRYKLPHKLLREDRPPCIGQKQKWFLLKLTSSYGKINLNASSKPEFDDWRWVSYWYPLRYVVPFKREVYRKSLRELAPLLFGISAYGGRAKPLQKILDE